METRSFAFLAALCCTVLLGVAGVSRSSDVGDTSTLGGRGIDRALNLGVATGAFTSDGFSNTLLVQGDRALILVSETDQGRDLNRDGDRDDSVVHFFDAKARRLRNLGVAFGAGIFARPLFLGSKLAFFAQEGAADLNGDGDMSDAVLQIYDTQRHSLLNVGLAIGVSSDLFSDGRRLAIGVEELAQGRDLNRDGDTDDVVPHLFDMVTGRVQNIGLAMFSVGPFNFAFSGRRVALLAYEGFSGETDFNGNGRTIDEVLHVFDTATGQLTNTGVALGGFLFGEPSAFEAGFLVGPDTAFAVVPEFRQDADLNGDGDMWDGVLHKIDLATGRVENTGIGMASAVRGGGFRSLGGHPPSYTFQEGLAVFNVAEAERRQDLNGDGDLADVVVQVLSTRTGQTRTLNVSATVFFSESLPGRAVLFMGEQDNGRDLNGDGDIGDSEFILALADLRGEPRFVSTGRAVTFLPTNGDDLTIFFFDATALLIRDNLVSFVVPEAVQGNRDLNGDGDTLDTVLHVADFNTFTTVNTGLSGAFAFRGLRAPLLPASDGRAAVLLNETRQGNRDLNGDGDTEDSVLQILDVRSGRSRNTSVAVATEPFFFSRWEVPLVIRGETFMSVLIPESSVDLNSDGDTEDRVLHLIDVATGKLTNVGVASGSNDFPRSESDIDFNFTGLPLEFGQLSGFQGSVRTDDGPGLGDAYLFLVSEADQGNIDLNGDGDTNDKVVHATRLIGRDVKGRFDLAQQ